MIDEVVYRRMTISKPAYFQKGVGLVELMVAILIGAFILAGVIQLYATSVSNTQTFEGSARIQENARYAFLRLEEDIVQAGSGGCFNLSARTGITIDTLLGLDSSGNGKYSLGTFVSGTDGAGKNSSDDIIVRYVNKASRVPVVSYKSGDDFVTLDETDPSYGLLQQYQVVYLADCQRLYSIMITNNPNAGVVEFKPAVTSPAGSFNEGQFNNALSEELISDISNGADSLSGDDAGSVAYLYTGDSIVEYSIDDSSAGTCSAANRQNCALRRNDVEIVEGVEKLEILYGWQNSAGALTYGNWAAVAAANAEPLVDRVKATLTFNSIDRAATLDGDAYLTKTFSRVFTLRNELPTS